MTDLPKKPQPDSGEAAGHTSLAGEWLVHYARLRLRTPALAQRLTEQSDEFELVPVPRTLLDALTVAAAKVGGGLPSQQIVSEDDPLAVVRAFADAMARAASSELKALLSNNYLDADGRTANEIGVALDAFLRGKSGSTCQIVAMEAVRRTPTDAVVNVQLDWSSTAAGSADAARESVALELLLERTADGWAISSIATR